MENEPNLIDIASLEQEITKWLNKIAKTIELKYRDFVPHFLAVSDCQDTIKFEIKSANDKIEELKKSMAKSHTNVANLSIMPSKKLSLIRDFLDRLNILNEIESLLSTMWINPEVGSDLLSEAQIILQLESHYNMLNSDGSGYLEVISDRILPLLFAEIASRKSELCYQLNEFFQDFFHISSNIVSLDVIEMTFSIKNPRDVSNNLSAMQKLGYFDRRIDTIVNGIWETFCVRIISGKSSSFNCRENELGDFATVFSIKKDDDTESNSRSDPKPVFSALLTLFGVLRRTFNDITVEGEQLIDLFSKLISKRLAQMLETDVLVPAIPPKSSSEGISHLLILTNEFVKQMKELKLFTSQESVFSYFFKNYNQIAIDLECQHFIKASKELLLKPYIDLIDTSSINDEYSLLTEKPEYAVQLIEKLAISVKKMAPQSDILNSLKLVGDEFNFQSCKISCSTYEYVNILRRILQSATASETEAEANRLVTTARNILDLYLPMTLGNHRYSLNTIPQAAAVFFNNCHYICHCLMTLQADVHCKLENSKFRLSEDEYNFIDVFANLRTVASNILEQQITNIRRQLLVRVEQGNKLFVGLKDENTHDECVKTLNACVMQINQISNVWKQVMPEFVLTNTMGAITSHLLAFLNNIILEMEDISSADSGIAADMLKKFLAKLSEIHKIAGNPTIQKTCEEPYFRMIELIFCLKASLIEIGHRWCEGKGPLALWLKASQVKHLVRALFENTSRRSQLISQIN